MIRPTTAAAGLSLVLALGLGACGDDGGAPTGAQDAFTVDVDVDTPQLRRFKQRAGIEACPKGTATAPPGGLPDLVLACLGGGREVNLSRQPGPLVINLWASWCSPCREELPHYQRLHERAGDKLTVMGIDYEDTQPGAALTVAHQAGVTYPLLADPAGSVRAPFRVVRGLPGVVFVDGRGRVAQIEYVVIESYPQLQELVAEHLGVEV